MPIRPLLTPVHPPNAREVQMAKFATCCSLSATAHAIDKLWDRKNGEYERLAPWRLLRLGQLARELNLLDDLYTAIAEEEQVQGR